MARKSYPFVSLGCRICDLRNVDRWLERVVLGSIRVAPSFAKFQKQATWPWPSCGPPGQRRNLGCPRGRRTFQVTWREGGSDGWLCPLRSRIYLPSSSELEGGPDVGQEKETGEAATWEAPEAGVMAASAPPAPGRARLSAGGRVVPPEPLGGGDNRNQRISEPSATRGVDGGQAE